MKLEIAFGVGLAATAAGGALWLGLPSQETRPAAFTANPVSSPRVSPNRNIPAAYPKESKTILDLEEPAEKNLNLDDLSQWANRDAPGAASFVLTIGDEDLRKECMLRVIQTWAARDPRSALSWAESAAFENPREREIAMCMACSQLSWRDPQEALRLASEYQLDENAEGLVEGLATRWAESELLATRDWVISQPQGPMRDSLVESIALVVLEVDPAEAARLVLDQIPPGESQKKSILVLLSQMALQNIEAAQKWTDSFPDGPLRIRALETVKNIQNRQNYRVTPRSR